MKAKLKVIKNWEFEEFELTGTSFKYSPTGCKGMVARSEDEIVFWTYHLVQKCSGVLWVKGEVSRWIPSPEPKEQQDVWEDPVLLSCDRGILLVCPASKSLWWMPQMDGEWIPIPMDNWCAQGMDSKPIELSTYSGYEQQLNNPIAPYFREHPVALCDLTKQDILAFYEKELERVKPTTVKHYHALIHGALNYAVDKNLIPSNPADRIIISKPEPFKGDYYLDSEVLNLFEVIKGHKIELVVLLTAFYGLRRSEVIGLKWSAFDFNHNCFSIRHTVTTCNVKGERVTIKKDKAKNKSSLRTYPLIPFLKERLLEAKKQQEENRKLCGRSYNKEYLGYVCVDVIGNLIKPNYVSSTFGKLLAKNNLRHIRFHDLRHTCASLLLANGVPMEQVKEWLGHSEISTTVDIYGHLQYATKKQSAAAIEQDIVAPMLQNLSAVSP